MMPAPADKSEGFRG